MGKELDWASLQQRRLDTILHKKEACLAQFEKGLKEHDWVGTFKALEKSNESAFWIPMSSSCDIYGKFLERAAYQAHPNGPPHLDFEYQPRFTHPRKGFTIFPSQMFVKAKLLPEEK